MKRTQLSLIFLSLIAFYSCSPKISTSISKSYPTLEYNKEVFVIGINQSIPENAENIGLIKIGDTGFTTKCSYEIVIDEAKLEARKAGGNAIKIVSHKTPSIMGSSCHRIEANILRIENIKEIDTKKVPEEELLDLDYAILNVYRYSGTGSAVAYDLHLGDSVICRVRNNYKTTIHIKKDGLNSLWAKTESKSELPVNIKNGKVYYLKCSVSMGFFVGHPHLEMVDANTGKSEFNSFNAKHQ